jgi:RHS repeat-associated protein
VNGGGFCCDDSPQLRAGAIGNGNDNPELYQYYYHLDHLGSTSLITNLDGEIVQHVEYVPFGEVFIEERNNTWNTPYLFNAKELDEETGLYYYGARYYDSRVSVWLGVDPMWEKYPGISPFCYTLQNPINVVDPDGRSTYVLSNDDGTYRVVGGNLDDKDLNIYLLSTGKNGELVKTSIGLSTSITSFYDSDNSQWRGTINPNDNSGKEFLDNFVKDNPEIGYYMDNAKKGEKYDFKRTNGTDKDIYGDNINDRYRGMPVQTQKDGTVVYTSARDVGNIAAGYIAGLYGIPWDIARKKFDALESQQKGYPAVEGISSQNAQRVGWETGMRDGTNVPGVRFFNWLRSIPTSIKILFK